jgi:hypothetical protein
MPPPIRDEDPPELRRLLLGSPSVVAENAMRLAWETGVNTGLLNKQVQSVSGRLTDLESSILRSLSRIETRLGIVEKKPIEVTSLTPSQRPISYHELPDAVAKVLPEVERRQAVAWWMALIDGFKGAFREGLRKGAASAVAAVVISGCLLAVGYFLRDCSHAIVRTGTSNAVPKIHGSEP